MDRDYRFKVTTTNGATASLTFQGLVSEFGIGEVKCSCGIPFKKGNSNQVLELKEIFEEAVPGTKVEVFYNGSQIF